MEADAPGPFTGTVGDVVTEPLVVRVTDASGRNVPGVAVTFLVTLGNGYVTAGGAPATLVVDSTGQDGLATVQWGLGTAAGEHKVRASVAGLTPIEFTATATAGPAAAAIILEASAFIAPVSSATDEPLAVRVEDEFGNAVAGVAVGWEALTAGGAVAAPSSTSGTNGVATVGATLGAAPGLYLFRVTPAGAAADTLGVIGVAVFEDPAGDQSPVVDPAYASHDLTHFGAVVVESILILYAKFTAAVTPYTGSPARTAMVANYDLDLDGDSLTGFLTLRQCVEGGAPLGFGADAFVDLNPQSAFLSGQSGVPPGSIAVLRVDSLLEDDRCTSPFAGAIYATVPAYQPNTVSIGVPLAFLVDDGVMAVTNLFAHPETVITDIVPDSLAWEFAPTAAVAGAPAARGRDVWDYLSVRPPEGRVLPVERMTPLRRPTPRR
jgi:hypothetical protein